jgi:SpoVK/Ycf46/Vps4 family AAA+-type ATPase
LAEALSLPIVRIDLSRVVSKYISDTEKNLAHVFEDSQRAGSILFFDEADSLFARHTEIPDSHDRYADLDTAHLRHPIESRDGLVILASNQPAQPDDPFAHDRWRTVLRRTVRFSLPRR